MQQRFCHGCKGVGSNPWWGTGSLLPLKIVFAFLVFVAHPAGAADIATTMNMVKNANNYPNYVLVGAHRGYWEHVPENSKPAYDAAIAAGADMVEIDVRLTRDRQLAVFHDACLSRVSTGFGKLVETDLEAARALKLKTYTGVVTDNNLLSLRDALLYLKGKIVVNLDIKGNAKEWKEAFVKTVAIAKETGTVGQIVFKGKLPLDDLRVVLTQAETSLDEIVYTPIFFSNTPDYQGSIIKFANTKKIYAMELVYKQDQDVIVQEVAKVKKLGPNGIWMGTFSFWPESRYGVIAEDTQTCREVIRDYNFTGLTTTDFLDDGRGDWDWFLHHGANFVIIDRPRLFIEYLGVKGLRQR